jgi:hypothetical protein
MHARTWNAECLGDLRDPKRVGTVEEEFEDVQATPKGRRCGPARTNRAPVTAVMLR